MTLYARIIQAIKEKPQTASELVKSLKANKWSMNSALRDLKRLGYIDKAGQIGNGFIYEATEAAEGFTELGPKTWKKQPPKRKAPTTVEHAIRGVPNSVFNLAAFCYHPRSDSFSPPG